MSHADYLRLNPLDQVAIACRDLEPGTPLENSTCQDLIPAGHKVALGAIASGESVRRYGQIIGNASRAIAPGQHVHVHNLAMGEHDRDYHFGDDYVPAQSDAGVTFSGIVRPDGRVATRNYLGVLSSVNCSATVVRAVADTFTYRPELLAEFPNIDGVVGLTHGSGCAMSADGLRLLRRTIAGYARHANFAAVLLIGLGCESNQIRSLLEEENLEESDRLRTFTIQESGGPPRQLRWVSISSRKWLFQRIELPGPWSPRSTWFLPCSAEVPMATRV